MGGFGKVGGFVSGEVKRGLFKNKEKIREALSIGRGDNYGWDINKNEELMRPSFSLGQYAWYYVFGKRPEWYDDNDNN